MSDYDNEFFNYLGALLMLFEELKMHYVQLYSTHSKHSKVAFVMLIQERTREILLNIIICIVYYVLEYII